MTTGDQRTFTIGKAGGLPRQGVAPQPAPGAVPPPGAVPVAGAVPQPGAVPAPQAEPAAWSVPPKPRPAPKRGLSIKVEPVTGQPEKPAIRLRRLAGVASWALVLVLAGVASSIVGLFRIFGDSPAWFTPAFISVGVVGMLLAMMAFATVRFKGVPWMFMAASTVTLLAAFVMLRVS
ncbi:hypothetical protein [Glycomyces albidus]|uniref:hypothetical protein n=1 Tax=Glycomyces albidus TaxID=2656774 RepID=UPI001883CA30|nr:hypothetical protein [Glycomyces albidus]